MASGHTMNSSAIHAKRDANLVSNVTYNNYGHQISPGFDPMTILQEHVAFGALHDSAERFEPPKCHPETRTAVLNLIDQWARDRSEDAQPVFWLTGAAGAGKSAIAQTSIERWKNEGMTVLSFFFWRTISERNQKTKLVPTLSYQLSERFPSTNTVIEKAVGRGGIFRKTMAAQLEEILLRPLEKVPFDHRPIIVVIDGLDECCVDLPSTNDFSGQDFKSQQREVLAAVASACQKSHEIRFLIVSRPEQAIRESFGSPRLQKMTHRLSLNDAPDADKDILLFFRCGFEEIRKSYPSLPSDWPGENRLSSLVRRSSGQFIYASTVVKYIIHRRQHPEKSLQDVLDLSIRSQGADRHPLADVDALYTLILKSVSTESLDIVRLILGILCYLTASGFGTSYIALRGESDNAKSPYVLEKLLFLSHGEVFAHLTELHSVLHIPPVEKPYDTIRIVHATLSEFLRDPCRSQDLHIPSGSFFSSLCSFTLRHVAAGKQEASSKRFELPFDETGMQYYFSYCLCDNIERVPYSKELKSAFLNFLEDEIGGYTSLTNNAKSSSRSCLFIHDCLSCGRAHYVGLHVKLDLLDYLLHYNTVEFEPSPLRRALDNRRLTTAKEVLLEQIKTLMAEQYEDGEVTA